MDFYFHDFSEINVEISDYYCYSAILNSVSPSPRAQSNKPLVLNKMYIASKK